MWKNHVKFLRLNFGLLTLITCLSKSKLGIFCVNSNIYNLKFQQLCDMKVIESNKITEQKLKDPTYFKIVGKSCPLVLLKCTLVNFCIVATLGAGIKNIVEKIITNFF